MEQAVGLDIPQRVFTWFYRRLGKRYPAAFMALELQTAWIITIGLLALINLYYDASDHDLVLILAISLGLTGATVLVALVRSVRYLRPLSEWIAGDRQDSELTAKAWSTAVGMPIELIRREMKLPIFGVAIPGSIAGVIILGLSPFAFFAIFAAALVAIGYSGILHYFAVEAGLRPVVVDINRVLSPRLSTGHKPIPLQWKLMGALPMINVITGLVASALSGGNSGGTGLGVDVLVATAVASTIAFELSILLARSIMRPIRDLEHGIKQVRKGNFDVAVPVTTADELGELSAAFNQMALGLAERERIREAFGTYLDKEVAEYILSDQYVPEGFEAEVSLLFCDARDFTGFASRSDAQEVVASINRLFETVVPIIAREGGHVDKFIGDGLLAVFGAPERFDDHAERAVRAAVEIARQVNHGDGDLLEVGVGVNSGEVVAGSIGGAGRLNFSVIGDPVNVASRVEAETRVTGDAVLITASTRELLGESFELESRGPRRLKGKGEPVELFAAVVGTVETPSSRAPAAGPARQPTTP
jgi:class 3 adenylate cyclase